MKRRNRTYRFLVLGAGFSHAAGLPLAGDLLKSIRKILAVTEPDNQIERDLSRFVRFKVECEGKEISRDEVDFEEFLGFLDLEHYLWLKGGDTLSREGNRSQLIIKQVVSRLLYNNTPSKDQIPGVYKRFVRKLNPGDWIVTFNYDTLLERALEIEEIPFRLFPARYSRVTPMSAEIDRSRDDEIVVIKVHGSVDWFDKTGYLEEVELSRKWVHPWEVRHPVFGKESTVESNSIVDGPRGDDDPLRRIYRVPNPGPVLDMDDWLHPPMILTPSSQKLLYMNALRTFWHGMQNGPGSYHLLAFIGYSLPTYDFYARQAFYFMARNYQNQYFRGKRNLRILNYCDSRKAFGSIKKQFRFLNWKKTEIWKKGFDEKSLDWLFG